MKKLLLLFMCLWCGRYAGHAQSLHVDSTRFITGLSPATVINYAIPTSDKGILFTGYVAGNPGGIIPACPYGGENVLIGKIDSNRQISWIKVYGGNDEDDGVSACETSDGGYAILATTFSHDGNVPGTKGNVDMWLLKLDASGNMLWSRTYGSSNQEDAISIANTPDGGFILLGDSNGSDKDVPHHYGSFWTFDWFVVKTDGVGTVQWTRDFGGSNDEFESGSILSVDSSYYLVGCSNSTDGDCTDTVWHTNPVNGYSDIYVLKLDYTGALLWDSSYGGSKADVANYAMFDTRDSSIVIAGATFSNDNMVTGYVGNPGYSDMWVLKVNKNGTLVWEKTFGGTKDDVGLSICDDPDNGYVIYGSIMPGTIGGEDCWMFLINNIGEVMDSSIFGGNDAELPTSILQSQKGYVACGTSLSTSFAQGATNGRYCGGENGYITYIDYWPLAVTNVSRNRAELAIFPNPVSNLLMVNIPQDMQGILSIVNTMGQVMYTAQIRKEQEEVDVASYAAGVYLVRWQDESGNERMSRFVKQ